MILRIITPEKDVVNQDSITFIHVILSDGYPISIYPRHAPLIALLSKCNIKYKDAHDVNQVSISEGMIKIENDVIKCFVNWANPIELVIGNG